MLAGYTQGTQKMPPDRPAATPAKRTPRDPLAPRQAVARSRVSNGRELLPGIDGRSTTARRYFDLVAAVCADAGGADRCSEARLQLIRRFAAAACMAEQMEARLANGEQIDVQQHAHLTSTMTRVVQRIGINRRARDVVPDLRDYLDAKAEIVRNEEDAA